MGMELAQIQVVSLPCFLVLCGMVISIILEITLNFDESAFVGASSFLLSAVLEQFFCKYVSINSFTQLVVKTRERGEIMRWPVRAGSRAII